MHLFFLEKEFGKATVLSQLDLFLILHPTRTAVPHVWQRHHQLLHGPRKKMSPWRSQPVRWGCTCLALTPELTKRCDLIFLILGNLIIYKFCLEHLPYKSLPHQSLVQVSPDEVETQLVDMLEIIGISEPGESEDPCMVAHDDGARRQAEKDQSHLETWHAWTYTDMYFTNSWNRECHNNNPLDLLH